MAPVGLLGVTSTIARVFGPISAAASAGSGTPPRSGRIVVRVDGLVHGYANMTGIHRASRDESIAVAGAFGAMLDTLPAAPPPAKVRRPRTGSRAAATAAADSQ